MPTARDVASWIHAEITGDPDVEIRDIGSLEAARAGDVLYALDPRYLAAAEEGPAAAVVVPRALTSSKKTLLKVDEPRIAFATLIDRFRPAERPAPGIHAAASVARDARLGKNISVGPFAVIESGATLGDRSVIGPGSVVGARASVGEDTLLAARVVIYYDCRVGARCLLHSGAVLGSDGFGFAPDKEGRLTKVRQLGNVVVGDDVEIGANSAIDRATFGSTEIGDGTKLDNLVHIGHNCRIGKNVMMAAGVMLSGSCEVGDNAILLGQVGVKDHLKIGKRAIIMPQSGLGRDVPDGEVQFGSPAMPRMQHERELIALHKLPELLKRVSRIEKQTPESK